jgi:hypothetical protein
MKEWISRISGWYSRHPRLVTMIVPLAIGVYAITSSFGPLFFAIPPLPAGKVQIVGLVLDGARFVVVEDRVEKDGKLRADILITFEKPLKAQGKVISFEAKREWVDCAKSVIELEGAGFYDERGEKVLTRYFERKPEAAEPIDMEVAYLCHDRKFDAPPVIGYRAAMQQGRALRSEMESKVNLGSQAH